MGGMRNFTIITFGCRTSQAESRLIGEQLSKLGFLPWEERVKKGERVDLVVLNTCAVTQKAEKEVRQAIRRIKKEKPDCFLVVIGCWVNKIKNEKLKIRNYNSKFKIFKKIDLLVRNKDKEMIGEILKKHFRKSCPKDTSEVAPQKAGTPRRWRGKRDFQDKYAKSQKALVKIQDGCDNFCTYCIVPYLRGRSRSVPADEIVKEINKLVDGGIKEVILTGIDIASYGSENQKPKTKNQKHKLKIKNNLTNLLKKILVETKVEKISFGSINLQVFTPEFIRLLALSNSNFMENCHVGTCHLSINRVKGRISTHFHIPLQSGCDATLKRMGRRYDIENIKNQISNIKKKIPDFTFSTDIILGFPGETEEEFEETFKAIREIRRILGDSFTKIHIFRYSPRPGTVAAKMSTAATSDVTLADKEGKKGWERVSERVKKERVAKIRGILA